MENVARFKMAYEHLKSLGKVHKQKDVAEKMNVADSNISKAFNGDVRYLTPKFLIRFNKTFGNIFNDKWLVEGDGEMLSRASPEKIKLNITMPEMPKMPETPNMIVKPLVYEKRKNTTMDMVKRLRLAVPEAKDTRASILMQHLFEQNPSVGLWVATGRDDKVVIDRMELEALRGQVAALKLLNESQSKEIEAIRKANI